MKGFLKYAIPSIALSFLFGIFPIVLKKNGRQTRLFTSICSILWTITYIVGFTVVLIMYGINDMDYFRKYTHINVTLNQIKKITFYLQIINMYSIYLSSLCNINGTKEALHRLVEADITFKKLGQHVNYTKSIWYQFIIIFPLQIFQIVLIAIEKWDPSNDQLSPMTHAVEFLTTLPLILQNLMESQYVLLALALSQRFQMVNEGIMKLNLVRRRNNYLVFLNKLKTLMQLHTDLCDSMDLISDIYGFQIFISFIVQFQYVLAASFTSIYTDMTVDFYICIGWVAVKTIEVLIKIISCHITANLANSTNIEITLLIATENNIDVSNKLNEFSQQLTHRKMEFTTWGLFPVNTTFIFNIVPMQISFLLILYGFYEQAKSLQCSI